MEEQSTLQPLTASQMDHLEAAVARYQAAVTAREAGWLVARGIEEQTARTRRLGVVSEPAPEHGRYRGMLAIPYLDKDGHPLAVRFRCLEDHDHREHGHGKYNSVAGEPSRLYGIRSIFDAGRVLHLCEGEFDSMILGQIGLHAVAAPGARSWKPRHTRMLAGFSRVYVWADPDEAGAEFAQTVTSRVRTAKTLRLDGGDVNEIYLAGGKDALLEVLDREDG